MRNVTSFKLAMSTETCKRLKQASKTCFFLFSIYFLWLATFYEKHTYFIMFLEFKVIMGKDDTPDIVAQVSPAVVMGTLLVSIGPYCSDHYFVIFVLLVILLLTFFHFFPSKVEDDHLLDKIDESIAKLIKEQQKQLMQKREQYRKSAGYLDEMKKTPLYNIKESSRKMSSCDTVSKLKIKMGRKLRKQKESIMTSEDDDVFKVEKNDREQRVTFL